MHETTPEKEAWKLDFIKSISLIFFLSFYSLSSLFDYHPM